MSPREFENYSEYLHFILKHRANKNPGYSLRAFARDIHLSPARLSQVLSGKGNLSPRLANIIAANLSLNEVDKNYFIQLIIAKSSTNNQQKEKAINFIESQKKWSMAKGILHEDFAKMSQWYYLAIWNYLLLKIRHTKDSLVKAFPQLDKKEIEECLDCLQRLELIEYKDRSYKSHQKKLTAFYEMSSFAVRSYHKSMIEQAVKAIDQQSLDERFLYNLILPMSKEKYPLMVEKFKSFMSQLSTDLEIDLQNDKNLTSIYSVCLQSFKLNHEEG